MNRFFAIAAVALVGLMGLNGFAAAQYPPQFAMPQVGYAGVAAVQVQIQQRAQAVQAVQTLTPTIRVLPAAPVVKPVVIPAVVAPERVYYRQ